MKLTTAGIFFGLALTLTVSCTTIPPRNSGGEVIIQEEVYQIAPEKDLKLYLFQPARKNGETRPAIVFFFGGGWKHGSPRQFFPQCKYLASRGMVAISADYRVKDSARTSPRDSVADARSAIHWVRSHAVDLGIKPDRIAAGGGSAGGHLAACTSLLKGEEHEKKISSRPNALVLFNPVLDVTGKKGVSLFGPQARRFSPLYQVRPGLPPTIIFQGTDDLITPLSIARKFTQKMKKAGNNCFLIPFPDRKHGFFNHGRDNNVPFRETMRQTDIFLSRRGYLTGPPTI